MIHIIFSIIPEKLRSSNIPRIKNSILSIYFYNSWKRPNSSLLTKRYRYLLEFHSSKLPYILLFYQFSSIFFYLSLKFMLYATHTNNHLTHANVLRMHFFKFRLCLHTILYTHLRFILAHFCFSLQSSSPSFLPFL